VAQAEGLSASISGDFVYTNKSEVVGPGGHASLAPWAPSRDWEIGGPLIRKGLISLLYVPVDDVNDPGTWSAFFRYTESIEFENRDPLVAAMRVYVASKFGNEVPEPGEVIVLAEEQKRIDSLTWLRDTGAISENALTKALRVQPKRYDHRYEPGAYGVCRRCGDEKHP
jgi:hypothetical protein